ncbi:MAG: hypothetical protein JRJ42_03035 [Deltaproteobacteria bacterium]|nr:hypothetical protein [Deltaproteobacteria bacterium]MBW2019173.1 hypothetical protein [Deltaproteobacteria bacterium]MBW2073976.1 hypothetical protein [Deltaproteobacteria bacterium]RLB80216.1 MAG: hypothetical protein DRH17_12480 [Deltaproteobacteria bacterium]
MTEKEAILGFMMGERTKAALIVATQLAMVIEGLADHEKEGANKVFSTFLRTIYRDIGLAHKISPQEEWASIRQELDRGLVMVDSRVSHGALDNLSRAISHATTISNRAMSFLKEKELL